MLSRYPAVVRLLPLDECPCFSVEGDAVQGTPLGVFGEPDLALKVFSLRVDRERVPAVGFVAFNQNELPNEIIQRGTQIVNGLAAYDAEKQRYRLFDYWVEAHDVPRSIEPVIDEPGVGVRFQECAKFMVEGVKVFVSPRDLESDRV